ncbi:histidine kinase [Ktedonobacteria bacterium brp13]|nr:histidine kinase [Ktedonobacteria bacterium brp13]
MTRKGFFSIVNAETQKAQRRSNIEQMYREKVEILSVNSVIVHIRKWLLSWHLSLFEKVILVNSIMLVIEAITGLWVTSHHIESQHYLIDTIFIIAAALFILFATILLLQASFRPLFQLLTTIRAISTGNHQARAEVSEASWEVSELAQAFNKMVDRLETTRREQTMLILQAQENERRRIGIELHDEAGQNLTALLIHTEVLHQRFQQLTPTEQNMALHRQLESELAQMTRLTQSTLESIHVLAQQLRPSVLENLGLLAAFRWLIEDGGQRLHLPITLETHSIEELLSHIPPDYETALYRIAQESLTNIARHALAQQVSLSLYSNTQHDIILKIQDDGRGFDTSRPYAGTGVAGMLERATTLGGTLTINSHDGEGTTILVTLPLPDQQKIPTEHKRPQPISAPGAHSIK